MCAEITMLATAASPDAQSFRKIVHRVRKDRNTVDQMVKRWHVKLQGGRTGGDHVSPLAERETILV